MNFATNCDVSGTVSSLFRILKVYYHDSYLRSGSKLYHAATGKCKRFNDFWTGAKQQAQFYRPTPNPLTERSGFAGRLVPMWFIKEIEVLRFIRSRI